MMDGWLVGGGGGGRRDILARRFLGGALCVILWWRCGGVLTSQFGEIREKCRCLALCLWKENIQCKSLS